MFSKGMLGESRVFNDGVTQRMGISKNRLDSVIQTLQEIKVLIDNYKEK